MEINETTGNDVKQGETFGPGNSFEKNIQKTPRQV
jgi:hypothetical protein